MRKRSGPSFSGTVGGDPDRGREAGEDVAPQVGDGDDREL